VGQEPGMVQPYQLPQNHQQQQHDNDTVYYDYNESADGR